MSLEKKIREGGYDQLGIAEEYKRRMELDPEWQEDIKRLVSLLPEKVTLASGKKIELANCTVVDLGSGPETIALQIKDKVGNVIAIDSAWEMVSDIRGSKDFSKIKNINPVQGDMTTIPLAEQSIEIVISSGTLFEIPPSKEAEDKFLSEIIRILKPGGVCILDSVCNAENDYMSKNFFNKRKEDLEHYKNSKKLVTQRKYVFLSSELESRFADLGYRTKVEPLFNESSNSWCAVRITFQEKMNQGKET